MKTRILITGARGFIGRAFWNYLEEHKSSLDISGVSSVIQSFSPRMIKCDMTQSEKVKSMLDKLKPHIIFTLREEGVMRQKGFFKAIL